ncbi:MAG: 5-formyltetrahydrofolate cyclo-ligase [Usitatibacter sp.]
MPPDSGFPEQKKALRRELIARRDAMPREELQRISERLVARVTALPEYGAARSLLATMAIGSEWSTRPLLERALADGKSIVLPRVTSAAPRHLEIHAVADMGRDLVPGVWDIPEPDPARCPRVDLADVDLALVPALAVDAHGYRLGYGAGYFDRLLAGRGARPLCVAALPAQFIVASLPHEGHDVPVDRVLALAP